MQIIFNIAENSNVELTKGNYELVQGECCVTELKFNFPATIRGVAIDNYKKRIEFSECKTFGECAKFIDDINGDTYELDEMCTAFKKIIIQVVLTYNNIKWKTLPVALEFHESVNAEGNTVIQAQLLSLSKIESEWENYIKAHTLRVIKSTADIPTADASNLGEMIFYLAANTDTAPYLVYGHYYKCNYVNGAYEWTDLTQDASLAGVADGVREINNNQTLQFWVGTTEELENEVPQENVAYIAEDKEAESFVLDFIKNPSAPIEAPDLKAGSAENAKVLRNGAVFYPNDEGEIYVPSAGIYAILAEKFYKDSGNSNGCITDLIIVDGYSSNGTFNNLNYYENNPIQFSLRSPIMSLNKGDAGYRIKALPATAEEAEEWHSATYYYTLIKAIKIADI